MTEKVLPFLKSEKISGIEGELKVKYERLEGIEIADNINLHFKGKLFFFGNTRVLLE